MNPGLKRNSNMDPWDIVCSLCSKHEETPDEDADEALDYAVRIGWRVLVSSIICPECWRG
jgi:hypothetical protein